VRPARVLRSHVPQEKAEIVDAPLVARFLEGDEDTIVLVDSWISRAAQPFRRRLFSEWPDLLQNIRLEVLELLKDGKYRGESRLKAYVWRVAAHTCLDAVRSQGRRPLVAIEELDDPPLSPAPSPLEQAVDADACRRLLAALEATPAECRTLWSMILVGMSYAEIGRQTGVSEGALRVRAHRCRKRAADLLARNVLADSSAIG
jgi:RNA polymerase sigma factor (sigma-70 family)